MAGQHMRDEVRILASMGLILGLNILFGCGQLSSPATTPTGSTAPVQAHCQVVDAEAAMSRDQLHRLTYIASGNSTHAMREWLGLPYCFVGETEYFPLAADPSTWIGLSYNAEGQYEGYDFSVNN